GQPDLHVPPVGGDLVVAADHRLAGNVDVAAGDADGDVLDQHLAPDDVPLVDEGIQTRATHDLTVEVSLGGVGVDGAEHLGEGVAAVVGLGRHRPGDLLALDVAVDPGDLGAGVQALEGA